MANATWKATPSNGNVWSGANWSTGSVPSGDGSTAFFGPSSITSLTLDITFIGSEPAWLIGGWTFSASASNYRITVPRDTDFVDQPHLYFGGAGIVLDGGNVTIVNQGNTGFTSSATAGRSAIENTGILGFFEKSRAANSKIDNSATLAFNQESGAANSEIINNSSGVIFFQESSRADFASIKQNGGSIVFADNAIAKGARINVNSGITYFTENSSADSATITIRGPFSAGKGVSFLDSSSAGIGSGSATSSGARITNSSLIAFQDTSDAGRARIVTEKGAQTNFYENSTGSAQLDNNTGFGARLSTESGGRVFFLDHSDPVNADFFTEARGRVDFSGTDGGEDNVISAGLIQGRGNYYLGNNQLKLEIDLLPSALPAAIVKGLIADGGAYGGTGGSLEKAGLGTLTLQHADNTYSGGTIIEKGTLVVASKGAAGSGDIKFHSSSGQELEILDSALSKKEGRNNDIYLFKNSMDKKQEIVGFGHGDQIDLPGLEFSFSIKATYKNQVLTLTSKEEIYKLALVGGYDDDDFNIVKDDDRSGGTQIVLGRAKSVSQFDTEANELKELADAIVEGGRGDDNLYRAGREDLFVFASGDGREVIDDLEPGDRIKINDFGINSFGELEAEASLSARRDDVVIEFETSDRLTLREVDLHDLSGRDFVF